MSGIVLVFLPLNPWALTRLRRALHLHDECPDMPLEVEFKRSRPSEGRILKFTTDPVVCGVYNGPALRHALSHMPGLRTIVLDQTYRTVHGIPWSVLQFILSLPQLREFSLRFHHFAPKTPQQDIRLACPAPLTSFEHTLSDLQPHSTFYDPGDGEEHAVSVVLDGVHNTLERLALTTQIAPLHAICTTLDWPNLRELRLRGDRCTIGDPALPVIAMFAHMSRLRILDLRLAQPAEAAHQPIWPIGYQTRFPWAELRHLTIAFPADDDQIYENLPTALHTLTLQCFPHITSKFRRSGAEGVLGPLHSSVSLQILRWCDLPLLRALELEYCEDDADDELLCHIAAAFPALRKLKVRRYRRAGVGIADVQLVCALHFQYPSCLLIVQYRRILRARSGVSRSFRTSPYTLTTWIPPIPW